jgi:ribulose-5-phosphate 4-epimerase/fuculose-1-phosphate aldolase
MSVHPITVPQSGAHTTLLQTPRSIDPLAQAKVHLAAAHRLAALHELEEGIDNHFTVSVPGHDDQFLILPFGLHWSEARASDMMVFNEAGQTLAGTGVVELSARCIHAPIHRITGARVVLHTHQTWAIALNMLQDNRLLPTSQTAAFFHGHVAYDDDYTGLADSTDEGERLARVISGQGGKVDKANKADGMATGDKPEKYIVFMKNHGVVVTGDTVAQAYRRLYKLERVCRNQLLAMGSGKPLSVLSDEVAARVQAYNPLDLHPREERERLYFEAMMRVLDRELPGYAD